MNALPNVDKFVPLTELERAAVPVVNVVAQDDGKCIMPVPAEAPPMPMAHPKLGKPSASWSYNDASGALLFRVLRFENDGGKEIRPLSRRRDTLGALRWCWKAVPEPRPLYGLDRLPAKPGAPVVICEGEKAADAAVLIFPRSVCITSSGGSQAAAKSDWSPLAGRKILIWPDADEPGQKYSVAVAGCLHKLGCDVSIIDAVALASLAPDGGQREPAQGWDAAVAIAERENIATLRKAANDLAKAFAPLAENICDPGPVATVATVAGTLTDPLPLFPPIAEAEPYPVDALGATLSRAAKAIASKVQVPVALASQSVLAVASLAACSHADVLLPYGQSRPLALFFATIAASGDRKSTADNEALWPVHKREKALREFHADDIKEWKHSYAAWAAEKRKIEADRKCGFTERKSRLATLGDEPERPLSPFIVTGDLTIEGLTKNWPSAHAALGIFTAEGGTFTAGHGMNDDNRLKTAAMLSELWDGKPVKRVRALDGVTILPGRRLALHVMIQPDASAGFLCNEALRDQGLLSRILVAAPVSLAGWRTYQEPCLQTSATIRAYGARILALLEAEPALEPGKRNELTPRALPLSADAAAVWRGFYDHVESQCGSGNGLEAIGDFAAKAAEHAARIAGAITIIEDLYAKEIGLLAMEGAIEIAGWYLGEADRLKAAGRTDPKLLRAAKLLEWLHCQPDGKATFREMLQFGPSRTKAAAEEVLAVLASHGWVSEVSARPRVIRVVAP